MDMNVAVPSSLLEDIFRLLVYLDPRYDHDSRHFHYAGYSQRLEHDNTLWQLWIKIKQLQARIVDTYLLTIGDITEDEKRDLIEWLERGYSVYSNPYLLSDERGQPMDFIHGCRVGLDMCQNPSDYFGGGGTDWDCNCQDDEELPWDDRDIPF